MWRSDERAPAPPTSLTPLFDPMFTVRRSRPVAAPVRIHADIELNLLLKGSATAVFGQVSRRLEPRVLTVFWACLPHQVVGSSAEADLVSITVPLHDLLRWALPSGLVRSLLRGAVLSEHQPTRRRRDMDAMLFESWSDDFRSGSVEERLAAAQEIASRLRRMKVTGPTRTRPVGSGIATPKFVLDAVQVISRRYRESLSCAAIAAGVGVHPNYLMTVFRQSLGVPMWEYVLRLRVAHAQGLLIGTDASILEVWLDSGFGSSARFYSSFKRITAMGPGDFRAAHRRAWSDAGTASP